MFYPCFRKRFEKGKKKALSTQSLPGLSICGYPRDSIYILVPLPSGDSVDRNSGLLLRPLVTNSSIARGRKEGCAAPTTSLCKLCEDVLKASP